MDGADLGNLNWEQFGELLGVNLAEGVAADPEAGVAAVNAVSLLSVRAATVQIPFDDDAHPTPDQTRRIYGPASNAAFYQAAFREDTTYRRMVVYNAHAGLFGTELAADLTGRMIQVLCYTRLVRAGVLAPNANLAAAQYQAMAMAEMLGPFVPADWREPQAGARGIIISAVSHIVTNPDIFPALPQPEEWFHPALGLGANIDAIAVNQLNIHQALVILEAIAQAVPPGRLWLTNTDIVCITACALGKRGTITQELVDKVVANVQEQLHVRIPLSVQGVKVFWDRYCQNITSENAAGLFDRIVHFVPDRAITIRNILVRAQGGGLTTYLTIQRAIAEYSDFPWDRIYSMARLDFENYAAAMVAIGANVYFGFNRQATVAAASKFRVLAFTSFQLCIRAGGDQPLRGYAGQPAQVPYRQNIVQMVEDYIERRNQAIQDGVLTAAQMAAVDQILEDSRFIFRQINAPVNEGADAHAGGGDPNEDEGAVGGENPDEGNPADGAPGALNDGNANLQAGGEQGPAGGDGFIDENDLNLDDLDE